MNLIYQSSNYNPENPLILDILIQTKNFSRYARGIRKEKSKRAKAHSAIKSSPHHYTQRENQECCRRRQDCRRSDKQNGKVQDRSTTNHRAAA